jgi:hypothetical protein
MLAWAGAVGCGPEPAVALTGRPGASTTAVEAPTRSASAVVPATSGDAAQADVRAKLRRALEAAFPGAQLLDTDEPRTIELRRSGGPPKTVVFLEPIERVCASGVEACDREITGRVEALRNASGTSSAPPVEIEHVLPTIKDRAYVEQAARDGKASPLLTRHWVGDLHVVLVRQKPGSSLRRYLDPTTPRSLGLSEDALFARAYENLSNANLGASAGRLPRGQAIFGVEDPDAAMALLDTARWEPLTKQVRGDLLASIPCGHILLFAGSGVPSDVDELRRFTDELEASEAHPVSKSLLRWTKRGWELHEQR